MTLFIVVAASSLVLAVLTAEHRRRPLALCVAFVLRIGLPSHVGDIGVLGVIPPLHISTMLILAYSVMWGLTSRKPRIDTQHQVSQVPFLCHLVLGVVLVGALASSQSFNAMGSAAGLMLNQIVAPYIFCMLLYAASCQSETFQKDAGRLFVLLCVIESIVALLVNYKLMAQPFLSAAPSAINGTITADRYSATLDRPLALGLLLAAGIPMTAYLRSRITAFLAIFIMVAGISVTQSRIALAGAFVAVAYLFTIGSTSFRERITTLIMAFAGYVFLNVTGITEGVLERIQNDEGSTRARAQALQLFADNWTDFVVSGVGLERNKEYILSQGLISSGESAAICYAIGIGIPLTLLYFGLIAWLIRHGIRLANYVSPASASAIIVFGSIQFFSSIATESAAGLILWTTIGIALAAPRSNSRHSRMGGTNSMNLQTDEEMANRPVPVRPRAAIAARTRNRHA
jgi:hypothetical protein